MNCEQLLKEIAENSTNGYETAILGKNGVALKYGSLVSDESELPDAPENCELIIWNNENINNYLTDFKII